MRITKDNLNDVFNAKQCSVKTMEIKGYELIDKLFVDRSGFGQEDERALTKSQFECKLAEIVAEYNTVYANLTEVGQFQVYMGIFKRVGKAKRKRVGPNLLRIDTDKGYKIRLYDTDIIEFSGQQIILFSGGHRTSTTKKYINKYLPKGVYIFQKNVEWYVQMDKKVIDFVDGMIIKLEV